MSMARLPLQHPYRKMLERSQSEVGEGAASNHRQGFARGTRMLLSRNFDQQRPKRGYVRAKRLKLRLGAALGITRETALYLSI